MSEGKFEESLRQICKANVKESYPLPSLSPRRGGGLGAARVAGRRAPTRPPACLVGVRDRVRVRARVRDRVRVLGLGCQG